MTDEARIAAILAGKFTDEQKVDKLAELVSDARDDEYHRGYEDGCTDGHEAAKSEYASVEDR